MREITKTKSVEYWYRLQIAALWSHPDSRGPYAAFKHSLHPRGCQEDQTPAPSLLRSTTSKMDVLHQEISYLKWKKYGRTFPATGQSKPVDYSVERWASIICKGSAAGLDKLAQKSNVLLYGPPDGRFVMSSNNDVRPVAPFTNIVQYSFDHFFVHATSRFKIVVNRIFISHRGSSFSFLRLHRYKTNNGDFRATYENDISTPNDLCSKHKILSSTKFQMWTHICVRILQTKEQIHWQQQSAAKTVQRTTTQLEHTYIIYLQGIRAQYLQR